MASIQSKFPTPQRYITTHDDSGKAIISNALSPNAQWQHISDKASFFLAYCTNSFPVNLSTQSSTPSPSSQDGAKTTSALPEDIATYKKYLSSPPGLTVSGGTVLRYVDMKPNHTSPMHCTVSLDYGVVLEGEAELILDSGETRLLKRGDTAIQRATAHAWRNPSSTDWVRMLFMLIPCEAPEVGGKKLREDLGQMEGVRASD